MGEGQDEGNKQQKTSIFRSLTLALPGGRGNYYTVDGLSCDQWDDCLSLQPLASFLIIVVLINKFLLKIQSTDRQSRHFSLHILRMQM